MAKKVEDAAEETVEHIDPETGEITYVAVTAREWTILTDSTEEAGDAEQPTIHAYEAGEFTPELKKMMGDMRKRKPDELAEEEAILEMYKTALGMA